MRRTAACVLLVAALAGAGCGGDSAAPPPSAPAGPAVDTRALDSALSDLAAARSRGDLESAVAAGKRAVALAPSRRAPWQELSNVFIESGRDDEAFAFFDDRVARNEGRPWGWFFRGYHAYRLNRWEVAAESFERASTLAPDDAESRFRLGMTRHTLGEFDRAAEALREAHRLDPDNATYAAMLARELRVVGEYDEAERLVAAIVSRNPDSAALQLEWGRLAARAGRVEEAEVALRRSVELHRNSVDAHAELAKLLRRTGREEEAAGEERIATRLRDYVRFHEFLMERLRLLPEHPRVPLLLAELELAAGRVREAERWLGRAAALGGDPARVAAARVWLAAYGRDAGAARAAAAGLDDGPRGELAHAMLAVVEGERPVAELALARALERAPDDKVFLWLASDLCRSMGHPERAEALLERSEAAGFPKAPG